MARTAAGMTTLTPMTSAKKPHAENAIHAAPTRSQMSTSVDDFCCITEPYVADRLPRPPAFDDAVIELACRCTKHGKSIHNGCMTASSTASTARFGWTQERLV